FLIRPATTGPLSWNHCINLVMSSAVFLDDAHFRMDGPRLPIPLDVSMISGLNCGRMIRNDLNRSMISVPVERTTDDPVPAVKSLNLVNADELNTATILTPRSPITGDTAAM